MIKQKNRDPKKCLCILWKKSKKSKLTDSNKVWKTVTPIFYSKIKSKNSITFIEGPKIIQEGGELAKTFNQFFVSIVKYVGINENLLPIFSCETRNVKSIIAKFENHPSTATIRDVFEKDSKL